MTAIYVLGAAWLVSVVAGAMLGSLRGNVAFGFLFPFVLGPLGLLVAYGLLREDEPVRSP